MDRKTVELRKIANGQIFRLLLNNVLYVRGDYVRKFLSFKVRRFDSVDTEVLLCTDTPVFSVSISEYH